MNIALVHEWLTNVAGSEKVLLEMKRIFPSADIYTAVYDPDGAKAFNKHEIKTTYLQKIPLLKKKRELLIPLTPLAFEQLDLLKYDLVISNSTMAAKGVITKPSTIHVCYCHTPARYLWEPQVDPRASQGFFSGLRQKVVHNMRLWDRLAADRVDHFLSNSKYIANRIKKYYRRDATVLYPPVDISKYELDSNVPRGEHFLFVSRLVNYKKCDLVIHTFNKLGLSLHVVGRGTDEGKLKSIAGKNIKFLGGINDAELKMELQTARALVFPAEEDFGIVPVEAMACGTPVIGFARGGVAETVINCETGILFEEQTVDSLILAIDKFQTIKFDPEKIRKRAENFSAELFEKNFVSEIEKIVKK